MTFLVEMLRTAIAVALVVIVPIVVVRAYPPSVMVFALLAMLGVAS